MSIYGSVSPVVEALTRVLHLFYPDQVASQVTEVEKDYLVVSYSNSLIPLWDFRDQIKTKEEQYGSFAITGTSARKVSVPEPNDLPPEGNVIEWISPRDRKNTTRKILFVVWDGMPDPSVIGSVNVASYVTPYDWLIALTSWQQAGESGISGSTNPETQVLLIDLTGSFDGNLESVRVFQQFQYGPQPAIPWAQIYRPVPRQPDRGIEQLLADVTELNICEPVAQSMGARSETSLLRRIWGARLLASANPRDHHSIANLLGPRFLLSAISPTLEAHLHKTPACLFALLSLVRVLSSEAVRQEQSGPSWNCLHMWAPLSDQGISPVFVLLDDMEELGWSEFLRLALGLGENDQKLLTFDRPDMPVFGRQGNQNLLELLKDEKGCLRIKQGVRIHPSAQDPILFLDLRLFSQRSVNEEMRFFTELLALAKQTSSTNTAVELPWRGFSNQELESIERCISQERVENEDYFLALTMLPRLIALVDPLLPIILFSSTGQRRISEALKGYENIITEFDKPKVITDHLNEVIAATQIRFERAFTQAIRILKGRNLCRNLQNLSPGRPPRNRPAYIEIYIDEAQNISQSDFRVGGIAMIYDDEQQAEDFNQEMVESSLLFGPTNLVPMPQQTIPKRYKNPNLYETKVYQPIEQIVKKLESKNPIGFCLFAPPELKQNHIASNQNDLTSPWCLDNIYRSLILSLLEVLLFEEIPRQLGQQAGDFQCGVYIATRLRVRTSFDSQLDWSSLAARYGVRTFDLETQGEGFISLASSDVYPIVAEVRKLGTEDSVRIVTARGAKLKTGLITKELNKEDLPRPAHFLADLAAHYSSHPDKRAKRWNPLRQQPTLRKWLSYGMVAEANARFYSQLLACRHARFGRHMEALLDAYKASYPSGSFSKLDRWAMPRIAQSASLISGRSLAELYLRLP